MICATVCAKHGSVYLPPGATMAGLSLVAMPLPSIRPRLRMHRTPATWIDAGHAALVLRRGALLDDVTSSFAREFFARLVADGILLNPTVHP